MRSTLVHALVVLAVLAAGCGGSDSGGGGSSGAPGSGGSTEGGAGSGGSTEGGAGSGGSAGSGGAAAAGGSAGTPGSAGGGGSAGTAGAGNPACAGADTHGFFGDCSACADPGNCDTIDVGASSRSACGCSTDGDCPCGFSCGCYEIAPNVQSCGLCVR